MTELPESEAPRRREWRLGGIIFFSVLAIALLYAAFLIIWPFMSAILIGLILVTLTYPTYRRVREKMKGRSGRAAVTMLFGLTFIVVIPAILLVILLVQQSNLALQRLQSGETRAMLERIDIGSRLQWVKKIAPTFDPATISPQRLVLPVLQKIPGWVARNGAAVVGGLAGGIIGFFLVLLSAYFFYVEGENIMRELALLSPLPAHYDQEFAARFKDVIDATFSGQVLTGLAQGLATGIGLAIAGVPGAAFWGAVAALLSLLPMVGAAAIWVPAGFAHGFLTLSAIADVTYKCTDYYDPASERSILWSDPDIGIEWPSEKAKLSTKDAAAPRLKEVDVLPSYS